MKKSAEEEKSMFDQIGAALDKYTEKAKNLGSDVSGYFNPPDGETTEGSAFWQQGAKPFLKNWGVPAAATTLGAAGLAGGLTAAKERRGEDKKERAARILKNMLLAGGGAGLAWGAGAGLSGLDAADDYISGLSEDEKTERFQRLMLPLSGAARYSYLGGIKGSRPNSLTSKQWLDYKTTTPQSIDNKINNLKSRRSVASKTQDKKLLRRIADEQNKSKVHRIMGQNYNNPGYKPRRGRGLAGSILGQAGGFYGGSILSDLVLGNPWQDE